MGKRGFVAESLNCLVGADIIRPQTGDKLGGRRIAAPTGKTNPSTNSNLNKWEGRMDKTIKWGKLTASVAVALAAGGLGALLGGDFSSRYTQMYKPLLSPPGWVFPAVWTILYVLMGLACYQVWQSEATRPRKKRALILYGVQLAMNALWPLLFFRLSAYLAAFIWLLLLLAAAWLCALTFRYIRKSAGDLLTPYLIWLFFAAYLNLGVYLMN